MKYFISFILSLLLVMPCNVGAEDIIRRGETLNIERCIEIALKMYPNIIAAKSNVEANISRVGQSKAGYYPQINWSSSYDRVRPTGSSSLYTTTDVPSGRNGHSFDEYSSGFNLSQSIIDFGKTQTQVNIQEFNLSSSRSDLEDVSEQVILNVKQAYYGVLQAKRSRDVFGESVNQFQRHLEQARGFYEVGTKPKFDVTKAEVDLSNAKLNLIKSENALKLAIVHLNNAMGITAEIQYTLEDNLAFQKYETALEVAVEKAYKNRPDLQSVTTKMLASESSIELVKKEYYPVLVGNAAYNWSGEEFPLDSGWSVGATLSFPIFSGFSTKYQVAEANANFNILKANQESLRQNVLLEVKQAYLNLKDAEERIPTAELTVKQAEENFEIANGRYAAGVGNPIEVTDAEVALSNAKASYIQALYDYKVAQASLEKAMGSK
ncbi:MAG: TolC family protein [Syntrophales bacterium]